MQGSQSVFANSDFKRTRSGNATFKFERAFVVLDIRIEYY